MKRIILTALSLSLLCGCEAIINHFDGKAQAWDHFVKYHAKVHPECGKSTFCKRLGHEVGPGSTLP